MAKYPGKCNRCGGKINPGDQIEWDKKSGASHVKCAKNAEPIPDDAIRISGGSGYGCHGWKAGEIIRNKYHGTDNYHVDDESWRVPEYLFVITAKSTYCREDGMSFGVGDESGYIYSATCRPASDIEAEPLRNAEKKRINQAVAGKKIDKIAEQIRTTGELPTGDNTTDGEEVVIDDRSRIYGGGEWFVVGQNWIWYVRNNGMDGDNWANNNVLTGGAGAIGWRVPYTQELEQTIRRTIHCQKTGEPLENDNAS